MTATPQQVWDRLRAAGVVDGDAPPPLAHSSPWYVRAMLGIAGWIGALFLLGFVGAGLAFVFQSASAAAVVGLVAVGGAFLIFHVGGRNDVVSQFGLATSFAGQVLIGVAVADAVGEGGIRQGSSFFFVMAVFEALLAVALNNFVHRVWSTFAACVALGLAMRALGLFGVVPGVVAIALTVLWLSEHQWAARGSFWRAIGFGLAFAVIQPDYWSLSQWLFESRSELLVEPPFWLLWMKPALVSAALFYAVHQLLDRHHEGPGGTTWNAAMAAAGLIAVATLNAPGITSSLLLVLLGFATGNRTLFGVGVVALLSYLSYFYYSLQATLLMKSVALGLTGIALLILWGVMRWLFDDVAGKAAVRA
jgi:hypothetical protein